MKPAAQESDRLQVEASLELAGLLAPDTLGDADRARWRAFARRTWGERARGLGWLPRPDDDEEARALRRRLVPLVAGEGEEAVLAGEALALGRRWLADRRQVPAEVAWPALEVAARRGDRALFDRILAEAGRSTDRTEQARLLGLLGRFEDPVLARAALALVGAPGSDLRDTGPILATAAGGPGHPRPGVEPPRRGTGASWRPACAPTRGPGWSPPRPRWAASRAGGPRWRPS